MNTELIYCTEKMKAAAAVQGSLTFYIADCFNGFQQGILKHIVNGKVKSVWMACNDSETNYLITNFSK